MRYRPEQNCKLVSTADGDQGLGDCMLGLDGCLGDCMLGLDGCLGDCVGVRWVS